MSEHDELCEDSDGGAPTLTKMSANADIGVAMRLRPRETGEGRDRARRERFIKDEILGQGMYPEN